MDKTIILGREHDQALREILRGVLVRLGAVGLSHDWAVGGSQEIETSEVQLAGERIVLEAETYIGLSIRGRSEIVDRIHALVNAAVDARRVHVLDELLAMNPKGEELRAEGLELCSGLDSDAIASRCIDGLVTRLATVCVLFFQVRVSSSALVESVVENGLFSAAIVHWQVLHDTWSGRSHTDDRRACLDAIGDLLSSLEPDLAKPRATVEAQLIAAFFLSLALRNELAGRPLLARVHDDVFLHSELRAALSSCTSLRELVDTTRHYSTK